jgi:hypothetical protein
MITKGLGAELAGFIKALLPDMRDVLVFGGIACASYGIYMIQPEYAFIFGGVSVAWIGLRAGVNRPA